MKPHLLCFYKSIAVTALATIDAVADSRFSLRDSNTKFALNDRWNLQVAAVGGPDVARAKIELPSTNLVGSREIYPLNVQANFVTPINRMNFMRRPVQLDAGQNLALQAALGTASANLVWGGLIVSRGPLDGVPNGQPTTLRGTSTTAGVAGSWVDLSMSWDEELPPGNYAVIGCNVISADGLFHQVRFEGQDEIPGGTCCVSADESGLPEQYNGGLGEWGRFHSQTPPTIRLLADGTGASHTVQLEVVPV